MGANYDDEMPLVTIIAERVRHRQERQTCNLISSTSVALLLLSLMSRLV